MINLVRTVPTLVVLQCFHLITTITYIGYRRYAIYDQVSSIKLGASSIPKTGLLRNDATRSMPRPSNLQFAC
jgi:hypothetical protein